MVTDVVMPDENIFDILPRIRRDRPNLPVIVMSAQSTLLTAVAAAAGGVFDYLPKPFDLDDMTEAARRALERPSDPESARAQVRAVRDERLPMIGRSAPMQELYRTVSRYVGSDLTVLIQGESGTGKALVARALHELGARREGRFVTIGLAALPRERVDSEIFGQGQDHRGKLVEADGGTLFLDEIGDMPLDSQMRLLRMFDGEEPAISPRTGRRPNVRVVAATNRDLRPLVAEGLFREDLFFRLNVAPVRVPPLRERAEDIPELARAFLLRAHREGLPIKTVGRPALERLARHPWPGNVRELENLLRRICALHPDLVIGADIVERELAEAAASRDHSTAPTSLSQVVEARLAAYFADQGAALPPPGLYDRVLAEVEGPLMRLTLAATHGNQMRAAEVLGLNRNTLRKRLRDLAIDPGAQDRAANPR